MAVIKRFFGNIGSAAGLLPLGMKLVHQLEALNVPVLRRSFMQGSVEAQRVGGHVVLSITGAGCSPPFFVGLAFQDGWFYFGIYAHGTGEEATYVARKYKLAGTNAIAPDVDAVCFMPHRGYAVGDIAEDDFWAYFSTATCKPKRGKLPNFVYPGYIEGGAHVYYASAEYLFNQFQCVDTGAFWRADQNANFYTQTTTFGKTTTLSTVIVHYATRFAGGYARQTPYEFRFEPLNIPAPADGTLPSPPESTSEGTKFTAQRERAFTKHMPAALHLAYGEAWPLLVDYYLPKWYYFSPFCFYVLTITQTPAFYLEKAYTYQTYYFRDSVLPGARDLYPYGHCYVSVQLYDALGEYELLRFPAMAPTGWYSDDCMKVRTLGHVTLMEDVSNRYCGVVSVVADQAAPVPRSASDIPATLDAHEPSIWVYILEPAVSTTDIIASFSITADTLPGFGLDFFMPDNYTPRQRWGVQAKYAPAVGRIVFHNRQRIFSCNLDGTDKKVDFVPEEGKVVGGKITVEGNFLLGYTQTAEYTELQFFVLDFFSGGITWVNTDLFRAAVAVGETNVYDIRPQAEYVREL